MRESLASALAVTSLLATACGSPPTRSETDQAATATPTATPASYRVSGFVAATTGDPEITALREGSSPPPEPLAGAQVQFTIPGRESPYRALTNEVGRFELGDMLLAADNREQMRVGKDGYYGLGIGNPVTLANLKPGSNESLIKIPKRGFCPLPKRD